MDRDVNAFRLRFKAYKEGKPVSEIYDAGLPKYAKGTKGFDSATRKRIDNLHKLLRAKGFDLYSIAGIIGNAIQESSLNPDSVNSLGYSGIFLNSKLIRKAIEEQYGDYSLESQLRYLDDWVSGNTWIRKGKYRDWTATGSKSFKRTGYKTAHEASDAFMKLYERPIIMENGKIIGYLDWDKRKDYSQQVYDYITGSTPVVVLEPLMSQTTAAELNAASLFQPWLNYHQPDYPLNNPAPSSISSWNNPKSPAYTPAGLQTRRIDFGKIMMDMLEDDWEPPTIQPLKTVAPPDSKISTFTGFKNGKLPGYKDGTRYLWDDQTQSWDRYTGDAMGDTFADFVVTPRGGAHKKDIKPLKIVSPEQEEYIAQNQPIISSDNNLYTRNRIAESNKRTWRSDAADIANKIQIASDIASTVYGAGLTNTVKNKVIKPLIRSVVKNAPTTDVERRFIEVMLRSTGGKGSGIDMSTIKNSLLSDKKHSFDVLKYITTGKGDAISLLPGDIYTGFRVKKGWDLPSIKLPTDNKNLGDIIDAILYNRKINPEYGVIPTQEPLFDFGLTPNAIKRYNNVSRYKVKPEYDNSYGFGNVVPPSLYNNITEKHLPIVYDDYGKPTRPTSIAVATSNRIGADLGHYDMQIGNLNNYPVYRWQDIYEFNPSAYKKSWDLYNSDFGGDSKTVMRLKNIFLDRLDKAHNPVTILRDWFSDPFGWPAENYGFTIN